MAYQITYTVAHHLPETIGEFATLDEAYEAARRAGAVGAPVKAGRDLIFSVNGYEDDEHAIWIEG